MCNTPPLRIMHAAAPGHAGGLESVVLDLTSGLRQRGHAVLLAAVLDADAADHPVVRRAEEAGVEVERIVVPPRGYLREYSALRRLTRAYRPDLVHTHGYRADLLAGAAARHEQVPWVTTVHGFTGGGLKNRLYEWLQVRAYRHAQGVVAVSRPIAERLAVEGVSPGRIHTLPNAWAAKPLLSREEARRRLGIGGDHPVIGWVGRLTREKGADVFLDSLALLPDRAWRASVVGAGRERPALEAQGERLGIADRVRWHGLMPDAAGLYSAFDLWVLSSRTEGTPIALFEAMAAGVPIVATSVGGVPDVVGAAQALVVAPEDPQALAAALRAVLSDPDGGRQRAEAARDRLDAAFSSGPWLEAHGRFYRQLVRPRTSILTTAEA